MSMPSCYGQVWEGVAGSLCVDQGCGVLDDCLVRFASGVLVDWQRQLGTAATVEQLAQATAVKPEAIQKALEFQKTSGIIPFPQAAPVVLGVDPAVAGAEKTGCAVVAAPVAPEAIATPEVAAPVVEEAPLAEVVQMPATAEAVGALKEVAEMSSRKKGKGKGKGKAAPKGKMPQKAEEKQEAAPAVTSRPKLAGPAKSARAPAKGRRACARPAAAQGGSKRVSRPRLDQPVRQWSRSPKMDRSRWQRERDRSHLIAQLRPGMKLRRIWEGQTLEVICVRGGYKFQGETYPTLYSVVMAIVGTVPRAKQRKPDGSIPAGTRNLTNWSAPKFFRLPWIIGGKKGHT